MSHNLANSPRQRRFGFGLLRLFGLLPRDKQSLSLCRDRMAALDDPETRRALAELPTHLLRDVGVVELRPGVSHVDGQALRDHLW